MLAPRTPTGTSGRHHRELRQYSRSDQQLIGLCVQVVGVAEHVFFKELERDQFDANLHAQSAPRAQKEIAQPRRAQGVLTLIQGIAQYRTQPRSELRQCQSIAMPDAAACRYHSRAFT